MKFQDRLENQKACQEALNWARGHESKQSAWDACPRADWMLWAWGRNVEQGSKEHKQLVLACCACARTSVKYIKDKKLKELVEKCLSTTEGWTRNENSIAEVKAARNAANAANAADAAAANAAYYAADAAAANAAAYYAASAAADAADYYAADAAYDAAYVAYDAAATYAARKAALKEMADMIRTMQPKCPKFLKKG